MKRHKAVFLDRDGTLIEDVHYLDSLDKIHFISESIDAIKRLKELQFKVIVVTNQSGVARGLISEDFVNKTHLSIQNTLKQHGASVNRIYYCPHYPDGVVNQYRKQCTCRKPSTGMIDMANQDFTIDLDASYMVGDRREDVYFAKKGGLRAILVETGKGRLEKDSIATWQFAPDHVAENLRAAVVWIESNEEKQK